MNIDMGIMASGTTSIQPEFKLDKTQYGSLGSVVYFGQVVGSICAAGLLAKLNSKCIYNPLNILQMKDSLHAYC